MRESLNFFSCKLLEGVTSVPVCKLREQNLSSIDDNPFSAHGIIRRMLWKEMYFNLFFLFFSSKSQTVRALLLWLYLSISRFFELKSNQHSVLHSSLLYDQFLLSCQEFFYLVVNLFQFYKNNVLKNRNRRVLNRI